jgi:Fe-Mn family superoxide dismutase
MHEQYARREFLRQAVAGGLGGIILPTWLASEAVGQTKQTKSGQPQADPQDKPSQKGNTVMAYTLPNLPYSYDALEPHIDEQTMKIHHDKHHNAYVTNLNKALEGHADLATKSVEELMLAVPKLQEDIKTAVRNNAGQHYNHSLYWEIMAPTGKSGGEPTGKLADAITSTFGGFAKFKEALTKSAVTCFGSGWAWLFVGQDGKLAVCATSNQENPLTSSKVDSAAKQLLVVDVWEHAYYLKYQNRRPDYLDAWWNIVNWPRVAERFAQANKA